ncbi:MAG: hypothetical protein ACJARE_002426, partial [Paracoccaceae bacterium]
PARWAKLPGVLTRQGNEGNPADAHLMAWLQTMRWVFGRS